MYPTTIPRPRIVRAIPAAALSSLLLCVTIIGVIAGAEVGNPHTELSLSAAVWAFLGLLGLVSLLSWMGWLALKLRRVPFPAATTPPKRRRKRGAGLPPHPLLPPGPPYGVTLPYSNDVVTAARGLPPRWMTEPTTLAPFVAPEATHQPSAVGVAVVTAVAEDADATLAEPLPATDGDPVAGVEFGTLVERFRDRTDGDGGAPTSS